MSHALKGARSVRIAALPVAVFATLALAVAPSGAAERVSAAYPFTDSIGVNTHLANPATAYYNLSGVDRGEYGGTPVSGTPTAAAKVKELLQGLGVHHVRYDFCPVATARACVQGNKTARMLASDPEFPVKFLDSYFGVGGNDNSFAENFSGTNGGTLAKEVDRQLLTAATDGNAAAIEAFEGPNERDRKQVGVADWAARLSEAQYLAASALGRIPGEPAPHAASLGAGRQLINPPLGAPPREGKAPILAGFAGSPGFHAWSASSATLDAANQHVYSYVGCPEASTQGADILVPGTTQVACKDSGENSACAESRPSWRGCSATLVGATKPIWVTETGYTNSLDDPGLNGMSERATAIYLPRLLLEGWRQKVEHGRGWDRTYVYELIDSRSGFHCGMSCSADREGGHGLVASNYAPKLQYKALKNLLALLDDPGKSTAGQTTADVSVAPTDQAVVRRLLFRKSDGTYVLALWRPVSVWRLATKNIFNLVNRGSDITEGTSPNTAATATVTLPTDSSISIYRPSLGAAQAEPARSAARTHQVAVHADVTLVSWK